MIILIGFMLALLVGAQLFPDSTPGRLLKKVTTGRRGAPPTDDDAPARYILA